MKHKLSISLEKSLHKRLIQSAKREGRSLSNFIEQLAYRHEMVPALIPGNNGQESYIRSDAVAMRTRS